MHSTTRIAFAATLLAGGFWGLSGTAAQALFTGSGFPVLGLAGIRMLSAGLVLMLWLGPRNRPALTPSFVAHSVFGLALSQVAYFEAIQLSNAVTATLLLFLFLPMVAGYEAMRGLVLWSPLWSATIGLAGFGTLLLVVNPRGDSLGILVTPGGLAFGLLSAVAVAYYSLAARSAVRRSGAWPVTAWGLLIGGVATIPFGAATLLTYPIPSRPESLLLVLALVGFVVIFGTIFAYGLYLYGLTYLSATEVGVAASVEPISAGVATFLFLGVTLTDWQYLGGALIVAAVVLLGIRGSSPATRRSA